MFPLAILVVFLAAAVTPVSIAAIVTAREAPAVWASVPGTLEHSQTPGGRHLDCVHRDPMPRHRVDTMVTIEIGGKRGQGIQGTISPGRVPGRRQEYTMHVYRPPLCDERR